ncbi:MAG: xanthine dehydrogenase family protein molybdopterin-binding subunit [Burkholderiaceae bacterium]
MHDIPERFGRSDSLARVEDQDLLLGKGQFVDDLHRTDELHLVFLRSPYAHAKIRAIDCSAAKASEGVVTILTGADLAALGVAPMPAQAAFKRGDGSLAPVAPRPILATDTVRFVGEPVAAVIAQTKSQALLASESIVVDYDPLEVCADIPDDVFQADLSAAPLPRGPVAETQFGDATATEAAFQKAAHVVRLMLDHRRLAAVTIEPRTSRAYPEGDRLIIELSSQMPTAVRDTAQSILGLPANAVRVRIFDVGGGFGMKTGVYAEDMVVAFAAKHLKHTVRWTADRSEDFLASLHGRGVRTQASLALDAQGKILGLKVHGAANLGAYPTIAGVAIQIMIGPRVQTGVYDIPTVHFRYQGFMTHTAPTGPYRGAGRPEAILTIERLMDEAARVTGIDRLELRRRNFIRPDQMPYKNPMAQVYDSGKFESVMNQAVAQADWAGFERRAQESAAQGLWRGLGIATFLEWTGGGSLSETVRVVVQGDGSVELHSAVAGMGQGIRTSLVQLVKEVFDLPPEKIKVVLGDTDLANGYGSAGSRSLFTGGSAASDGASQALEKAKQLAGQAMEVSPNDLVYAQGVFTVAGTDLKKTLAEVAQAQADHCITIDSTTTAEAASWPNACHICEATIDPATGVVRIEAYSSVNDVGRVVNETIVLGQLDGGAMQGIGQALCEQMVYDPESGQLLTGSLMDYTLPRADFMHGEFKTALDQSTPCLTNLLGVKGVGELGTIGATPALVNAIADALARHGIDTTQPDFQVPFTPYKVWSLLQSKRQFKRA